MTIKAWTSDGDPHRWLQRLVRPGHLTYSTAEPRKSSGDAFTIKHRSHSDIADVTSVLCPGEATHLANRHGQAMALLY